MAGPSSGLIDEITPEIQAAMARMSDGSAAAVCSLKIVALVHGCLALTERGIAPARIGRARDRFHASLVDEFGQDAYDGGVELVHDFMAALWGPSWESDLRDSIDVA